MNANLTLRTLDRLGVEAVLNALADGVYLTDKDRRILFWNQAAGRITGWAADQVAGRTCFDNVLVHVDQDGHRLCGQEHCPLHRSIVTGEASQEPLLVFAQHRHGHRVPVEVAVAPIRDDAGEVIGGIETFRDSTCVVDDMHRARVIQDQMLGESRIVDPRVRVSVKHTAHGVVGGDFYRLEQLDPDRFAFFLADVMGHGLASALYTMQLRVLWDDTDALRWDPAQFMKEVNARLEPLVRAGGYFATAVFALLNAATGELNLVRAGHPAPLLRDSRGVLREVGAVSPALGLRKQGAFLASRDYLGRGDVLLLFTDGAVETGTGDGEDLGLEGFQRLIHAMAVQGGFPDLADLERALLERSGGIRLPDDLTLISVSRE